MNRHICIHGHFYQPPRENPWTGEVDQEDSAKPYHDWNERISKECYEANTAAPILNSRGQVTARINNYSKISFDFGPTLFNWMRRKEPATYKAIIEGDKQSVLTRNGHGNAMAQVYNHIIMPLAKPHDKLTQVLWGIKDFEFHFKRKPEGMWLSETAVDRETLRIMAENGIKYTVLAPHQASRVRRIGFWRRWTSLRHETINPRESYRILLDKGQHFHIFFYDAPVSRAIAFQGLLFNGDQFDQRLLSAFSPRDRVQLVSTATDGESFGHHHKYGEMAIAYGLKKMEDLRLAELTNFGEYLDRMGSFWEVDIYENSSWSCAHGVERWRADCGCRINYQAGWNQKWRVVLREAFDFLKEVVDGIFESETDPFLKDPWQARNDYIHVILDASEKEKRKFIAKNAKKHLTKEQEQKMWNLLEAERFAMYMYTSCAWFFDDISGIEPVHMMKFALRAIELVQPYCETNVESEVTKILAAAKSNIPEMGSGADVFERFVRPAGHVAEVKHGV